MNLDFLCFKRMVWEVMVPLSSALSVLELGEGHWNSHSFQIESILQVTINVLYCLPSMDNWGFLQSYLHSRKILEYSLLIKPWLPSYLYIHFPRLVKELYRTWIENSGIFTAGTETGNSIEDLHDSDQFYHF